MYFAAWSNCSLFVRSGLTSNRVADSPGQLGSGQRTGAAEHRGQVNQLASITRELFGQQGVAEHVVRQIRAHAEARRVIEREMDAGIDAADCLFIRNMPEAGV